MEKNILRLAELGKQAANNADAGGVLIDLVRFRCGDSDIAALATQENIQGNSIYTGDISFVEVLDDKSVRFTFDIPEHVAPDGGIEIKEVAVYLPSNVMFGRCVLVRPVRLEKDLGMRINCILATEDINTAVINVTIGELSSIPSTPYIYRLPSPVSAQHNAINVLDLMPNSDSSSSSGMAMRFGAGAQHWAFSGHDRIYHGYPDVGTVSATEFAHTQLVETYGINNDETVIVQIVTGPGAGESRRYKYDSVQEVFIEKDNEQFSSIGQSSVLSIWRKIGGNMTINSGLPSLAGVPSDWSLQRGVGDKPMWAPVKVGGKVLNTLYRSPGRMKVTAFAQLGDGQTARFPLGGLDVKNSNHVYAALGSVTQHRQAFDVNGNELEFAEEVPQVPVDMRVITKEAGTGTYVDVVVDTYVCDGATLRFPIAEPIEAAQYAWVFIQGGFQATPAYTYDAETQEIVFTEAPRPGHLMEINSLVMRDDEGYSCEPLTMSAHTREDTQFLTLPVKPQSKDHTFISIGGVHLHRNAYSVVEDKAIFSTPIPGNREVEVFILQNYRAEGTPQTNLQGVVTDAALSSKNLLLFRHGDTPIRLPIPAVEIASGRGIKVSGIHPNYKIESTLAEAFSDATQFKYSTLRVEENQAEIIYTYRVDIKHDLILDVTADFSADLGPGFDSPEGLEIMQYAVGFRTTKAREPDYGRRIKGTGEAGFAALQGTRERHAFSNSSIRQTFEIVKANIPAGYIDVVARMRIKGANVSKYGSVLSINFNVTGLPKV